MPRMKITVTAAHIKDAIQKDAYHCMIALAVKEKIPNARWVDADTQSIRWTDRTIRCRFIYMTPQRAKEALIAFDEGRPVKPFQITLPAPQVKPIPQRKPRKAKAKAKVKKIYKKKKVAPEKTAVRRYGLRLGEASGISAPSGF